MGALKKKAGYFAYWLIPLVDLDILGVLGLDSLPLVEKIGISELTGGQKVLLAALILIPYFDLELLKLLGLNPLESSDQPTLDPAYHDKTAQRPEDGRGGGQGDFRGGVKQGFQDTVNINVSKEDAGTSVGKVLGGLVVLLVVFFMLLFLVRGTVIGEYLGYGQETVGDRFVADLPTRAEGPIRVYMQARDRVFCLLEGPACLREHRLNRTTRPGSDEVGQNYGLKIDRFEVGQGDQLDVAHKNADYQIPISFTLSNPRHGLKGINARNVEYRLMMIDNDRDRSDPYCDTGWIGIQDAYDADGDDSYDDIFPGTSASTGFLTITSDGADNSIVAPGDGITLQDCEMLQPALGQHRTMLLNVKYDYFSQATLNFEAMSQENFQSNPEIQKVWKGSQTADTPVKAAINVNSPVLFREGTGEPRSFGIRATLNTDKSDVEYQVKDLLVRNSEYVQSSDGTCQLENVNGEHDFSPGEHLVPRDGVDGARTGVPDTEYSEL